MKLAKLRCAYKIAKKRLKDLLNYYEACQLEYVTAKQKLDKSGQLLDNALESFHEVAEELKELEHKLINSLAIAEINGVSRYAGGSKSKL